MFLSVKVCVPCRLKGELLAFDSVLFPQKPSIIRLCIGLVVHYLL